MSERKGDGSPSATSGTSNATSRSQTPRADAVPFPLLDLTALYNPHGKKQERRRRRRKRKPKKNKIYLNLTACRNTSTDMVRAIIRKYRWVETEDTHCDVVWSDQGQARTILRSPEWKFRAINQFPEVSRWVAKSSLEHLLALYNSLAPDEYNFFPNSWDLTSQLKKFRKDFQVGKTYILKPSAGRQGTGIHLVQTFDAAARLAQRHPKQKYVAQLYLDRPLLIDGYKFDLRIYAMLESIHPLKVHVFRDGLARLATSKYVPPTRENLSKAFMHLTNYSLNKDAAAFQEVEESGNYQESKDNEGSKRSIKTAFAQLLRAGVDFDVERFWAETEDIVAKTVLCMYACLWGSYCKYYPDAWTWAVNEQKGLPQPPGLSKMPGLNTFHIMGFDIIIDGDFKPYLLEVNAAPSMGTGSVVDLRIKQSVVERALDIMGIMTVREVHKHHKRMEQTYKESKSQQASPGPSPSGTPKNASTPSAETPSAATNPPKRSLSSTAAELSDASGFSSDDDDQSVKLTTPKGRAGSRRSQALRSAATRSRSARPRTAGGTLDPAQLRGSSRDSSSPHHSRAKSARRTPGRQAQPRSRRHNSQAYLDGLRYLDSLRSAPTKQEKSLKSLAGAASHAVNFATLEYTSLRPAYTFRDLHIFGHPALSEAYGVYCKQNFSQGMSSPNFIRCLLRTKLVDPRTFPRVDAELLFMRIVREQGSRLNTMNFNMFCEGLLEIAIKLHPSLHPLEAFGNVLLRLQADVGP